MEIDPREKPIPSHLCCVFEVKTFSLSGEEKFASSMTLCSSRSCIDLQTVLYTEHGFML